MMENISQEDIDQEQQNWDVFKKTIDPNNPESVGLYLSGAEAHNKWLAKLNGTEAKFGAPEANSYLDDLYGKGNTPGPAFLDQIEQARQQRNQKLSDESGITKDLLGAALTIGGFMVGAGAISGAMGGAGLGAMSGAAESAPGWVSAEGGTGYSGGMAADIGTTAGGANTLTNAGINGSAGNMPMTPDQAQSYISDAISSGSTGPEAAADLVAQGADPGVVQQGLQGLNTATQGTLGSTGSQTIFGPTGGTSVLNADGTYMTPGQINPDTGMATPNTVGAPGNGTTLTPDQLTKAANLAKAGTPLDQIAKALGIPAGLLGPIASLLTGFAQAAPYKMTDPYKGGAQDFMTNAGYNPAAGTPGALQTQMQNTGYDPTTKNASNLAGNLTQFGFDPNTGSQQSFNNQMASTGYDPNTKSQANFQNQMTNAGYNPANSSPAALQAQLTNFGFNPNTSSTANLQSQLASAGYNPANSSPAALQTQLGNFGFDPTASSAAAQQSAMDQAGFKSGGIGAMPHTLMDTYTNFLQDPNLTNNPAYQQMMNAGLQGTQRGMVARGMQGSGNILQELQKTGMGIYGQYIPQIAGMYGQGAQTEASNWNVANQANLNAGQLGNQSYTARNNANTAAGQMGNQAFNTLVGANTAAGQLGLGGYQTQNQANTAAGQMGNQAFNTISGNNIAAGQLGLGAYGAQNTANANAGNLGVAGFNAMNNANANAAQAANQAYANQNQANAQAGQLGLGGFNALTNANNNAGQLGLQQYGAEAASAMGLADRYSGIIGKTAGSIAGQVDPTTQMQTNINNQTMRNIQNWLNSQQYQ